MSVSSLTPREAPERSSQPHPHYPAAAFRRLAAGAARRCRYTASGPPPAPPVRPGALVVAGDEEAAAVCQVVDLVPAGDGTIVHLRLLPGLVDDYRALVERALAS